MKDYTNKIKALLEKHPTLSLSGDPTANFELILGIPGKLDADLVRDADGCFALNTYREELSEASYAVLKGLMKLTLSGVRNQVEAKLKAFNKKYSESTVYANGGLDFLDEEGIVLARLCIEGDNVVYTQRPQFILSYMTTGDQDDFQDFLQLAIQLNATMRAQ